MPESTIVPLDLARIINLKLNNSGTAIVATISSPLPIALELSDNFSISSKKNIAIYTEDKLHLNPEYPNGDIVLFDDIERFNTTLDDINNTLHIAPSCNIESLSHKQLQEELNQLKNDYVAMGKTIERLEGLMNASDC